LGEIDKKLSEIQKLYELKQFDRALMGLNKLIKNDRYNYLLYNYRGLILNEIGENKSALINFKKSIELNNKFSEAYANLGLTYRFLNDYEKAILNLKNAIKIDDNNLVYQINLTNLYLETNKNLDAIDILKKALSKYQNIEILHNLIAEAYIRELNYDDAFDHHKKALFISPRNKENLYLIAVDHIWAGNNKEAINFLEMAINHDANFFKAHFALSRIKKISINDEIAKNLLSKASDTTLLNTDKVFIHFALSKIYHNEKMYDLSFNHLDLGNSLMKSSQKFNIENLYQLYNQVKQIYKNMVIENESSSVYPCPVFIVGMPRAGSSLLEQILSGSSEVFGAGEINELHLEFCKLNFKESNISNRLEKIKEKYVAKISSLTQKPFIIDKLPLNFYWLGFIKKLIPNAKFIHIQRDPTDNCFSILNNLFVPGTLEFSYSQSDIIDYYHFYKEFMHFWQNELNQDIYNICYEDLISNPNHEIKDLCNYIGIPYDKNMLDLEKNQRKVRTASDVQIRGHINSKSVKSWVNYQEHIGLFLKAFK